MCKRLLSDGAGAQKKQSRVLTRCEEETIWETGAMGSFTPASLQNTIFFYCGLYFCLCGGSEHRDLKISQFEVKQVEDPNDSSKMTKCVIYCEHGSKNHQGLVHQMYLENKNVSHFANESLGERCFVRLFESVHLFFSYLSI